MIYIYADDIKTGTVKTYRSATCFAEQIKS